MAPSSLLTKEQGTWRQPERLVTLNSLAPHTSLLHAFVFPESSLPVSVTGSQAKQECLVQICIHLQKCVKYKDKPTDTQMHACGVHLSPMGAAGQFDHHNCSGPEKVTGCF